ncbi:type II secretion system F family protein [Aureimonas sp. AU40]|uniref:type II secretion system F family protein n=1 Tax=Aureimonas sp. AU40 TaxID=1637747 RepID=UPI0007849DEF|nr:type II secretion system F family protein [Aureimonas sp. AU40]
MITILFVALVALSTGALLYGVLQPRFESDKAARSRFEQFSASENDLALRQAARDRMQEVSKRRKTLQATLQDFEEKNRKRSDNMRKLTLEARIRQAGFDFAPRAYWLGCAGIGVVAFLFMLVLTGALLLSLGLALSAGLGLPHWFLGWRRTRRQRSFSDEFANALDVIVRGIKSGLPLQDTLRMIASETPDPVRSEFARIVEALQMGAPLTEAVGRLYASMPMPETNFFAIVVSIQSQSGGNLAEALNNLSRVLRDRKKMKGKIKAMSMEAKASAYIIGSLPIIVAGLVYLTSPDYISILFTDPKGHMILMGSGLWMLCGILVMRKMINFDF